MELGMWIRAEQGTADRFPVFGRLGRQRAASGEIILIRYCLWASIDMQKIGGGVLGDVWHPEERGKAIAIYSLAPLLGPVIGPVCGGWYVDATLLQLVLTACRIAERSTWRWVFWSTSIIDVGVQILGLFFLQESQYDIAEAANEFI